MTIAVLAVLASTLSRVGHEPGSGTAFQPSNKPVATPAVEPVALDHEAARPLADPPPAGSQIPAAVSIALTTDPPGAEVWVEGATASLGKTPMTFELRRSRESKRITLVKAGFKSRTLALTPEVDREIPAVKLERRETGKNGRSPATTNKRRPYTVLPD